MEVKPDGIYLTQIEQSLPFDITAEQAKTVPDDVKAKPIKKTTKKPKVEAPEGYTVVYSPKESDFTENTIIPANRQGNYIFTKNGKECKKLYVLYTLLQL